MILHIHSDASYHSENEAKREISQTPGTHHKTEIQNQVDEIHGKRDKQII
jgi:hypothetical protein